MAEPVLRVSNLTIDFPMSYGMIGLVRDVTFDVHQGECLGLVGESGCGKSILGLSLMGLQPPEAQLSGQIMVEGRNLLGQSERQWRLTRSRSLSMIYQDALTSLNPAMRVERQLRQALSRNPARTPADLLDAVQIRDVQRCLRSYPHELSGGQRQRVLIALAIAGEPRVIIADEPTTALDVTVQAQVMSLLDELRGELRFALVFISHDLGLVARVADRVAVMYAGDLVEIGLTNDVLTNPQHPYAAGLLEASRSLEEGRQRLAQIPGSVPAPSEFLSGCRFAPRCQYADVACQHRPVIQAVATGESSVACWHPIEVCEPLAAHASEATP